MAANLQEIVEILSNLTLLEASELSELLEDKWGVSGAPQYAVAAGAGGGAGASAEATVEKTEFDVILVSAGESKINVIREVREITGLGLKEAKDLVEAAPKALKEGISKAESEQIKEKLEKAGAKVDIK